jgi:hypothetical protein
LGATTAAAAPMLAALVAAQAQAADVTSTWNNSTSLWSVSTNWVNVPALGAYPNNGNAGVATYDAAIAGGSVTLDVPVNIQRFTLTAGTFTGGNTLTTNDLFIWGGGTLSGTGTLSANGGILLNLGTHTFNQRIINNPGTATWSAGAINSGSGAVFNNTGTFNAAFNGNWLYNLGGNPVTFNNPGVFRKTAGTNQTVLGMTFNNTGTVAAEVGTLALDGGGAGTGQFAAAAGAVIAFGGNYSLDPGATLVGDGIIRLTGNTLTIAGNIPATNFELTNGTLGGGGTFTPNAMTWTAGTQSGSGVTSIPLGGTLALAGTTKTFTQRTISNSGTATWSAGNVNSGAGATFNNRGTFNATVDANWTFNLGGASSTFNNFATVNRTTATGTATFGLPFNNLAGGTVNVQSGTLQLNGGGSAAGSFAVSSGATLQFNGDYALENGAAITGAGLTRLTGGNLSVNASVGVPRFEQTGGGLTGAGALAVGNALTWSGGTMSGTGNTLLSASATGTFDGATKTLSGRRIENSGTINWTAGGINSGGGSVVQNFGTFNANAAAGFLHNLGGTATVFNNPGVVNKSSGTGVTTLGLTFNNSGTVSVSVGTLVLQSSGTSVASGSFLAAPGATLNFSGTTHNLQAGASISGGGVFMFDAGTVNVNGGTYNVSGTTRVSGGTLNLNIPASSQSVALSAGALGGSATLSIGALMDWSGGTHNGAGTTLIPPTATLTLQGGTKSFNARTISNSGTANWTAGGINTGAGAVFRNFGAFNTNFDGSIAYNLGVSPTAFNNFGQFTKTAGAGDTTVALAFNNSGTVTANSGDIRFTGGGSATGTFNAATNSSIEFAADYTLSSGAALAGAGTTRLASGTLTFDGDVNATNFAQAGGILTGAGNLTASSTLLWTAGSMTGAAETRVAAGGTFTLSGTTRNLQRTISSAGTTNWTAGNINSGSNAVFNNSGAFVESFDGAFSYNLGLGVSTFNNTGSFTKSAGPGTASFTSVFNNSGTVQVNSGTLLLSGGGTASGSFNLGANTTLDLAAPGYAMSAGSSVTGQGRVRVSAGTSTIAGSYDVGATTIDNATLNFVAGATPNSKTAVTGTLTIATGGRLDLANNGLILDYATDSPMPTVRASLGAGFGPGNWSGNGIRSSSAAADPNKGIGYGEASTILGISGAQTGLFNGKTVDATAVLFKYVLRGDANLDGRVDFSDLVVLAQNYNTGGVYWTQGDFTYEGSVNFPDLVALAQNYNAVFPAAGTFDAAFEADLAAAFAQAPEPGAMTLLALAFPALLARRRKSSGIPGP